MVMAYLPKIFPQELLGILCDYSAGCEEAENDDDSNFATEAETMITRKRAKIRNLYNQAPDLTKDTDRPFYMRIIGWGLLWIFTVNKNIY